RPGTRAMGRILDDRGIGYVPTATQLEDRFRKLVERAGLPQPERQRQLGDAEAPAGRVDFVWPDSGLVVEVDGRRWHTAKLDMDADRRRDQRLVAGGYRVIRVTWDDMVDRPDETAGILCRALGRAA